MHYLTKKEYSILSGISRPTINKRIEKGTLTIRTVEGGPDIIMLEDTQYDYFKNKGVEAIDSK